MQKLSDAKSQEIWHWREHRELWRWRLNLISNFFVALKSPSKMKQEERIKCRLLQRKNKSKVHIDSKKKQLHSMKRTDRDDVENQRESKQEATPFDVKRSREMFHVNDWREDVPTNGSCQGEKEQSPKKLQEKEERFQTKVDRDLLQKKQYKLLNCSRILKTFQVNDNKSSGILKSISQQLCCLCISQCYRRQSKLIIHIVSSLSLRC